MEQLVNFIIRPPRAEYDPTDDLLDEEFMIKGKWYRRNDLEIKNSRGHILQCSHYFPIASPEGKPLPCVIYCHGNSGCRADGSEAAIMLLPSNITVFTLDFSGSGLSGGKHVSLGWHEKDDLRAVVDHLRADQNVSLIGLWGRSMGAVTSLMYGAEDPSIAGMVLDSPFSDLVELMMEQVDSFRIRLPKFTVKFAIHYIRRVVLKKAKFDVMDLNTIKAAKACFVPVLLGHAVHDDFIRPHHSDRIFDVYMGDKNIIRFEGDHNSRRPKFYFDSVNIFFRNVLQPPEDEFRGTFFKSIPGFFGEGLWETLPGNCMLSSAPKGDSTSSTADTAEEINSRGLMSRTEVPSNILSGVGHCNGKDPKVGEDHSLSSNMISFELSSCQPYGLHVPTCLDDDQYIEYELDDLSGVPSNGEEEERMVMQALLESLKDLEMRGNQADQPSSINHGSVEPLVKDCQENASVDKCSSSVAESSSFSSSSTVEHAVELKAEPILAASQTSRPMSVTGVQTSSSEHPSPELNPLSSVTTDASAAPMECIGSSSSECEKAESMQSLSDTDISASTKATLTVERNPASCIMDGLLCRWDRKLFGNSDNR